MCEVLDRVEARGIEKGIAKGIEQGIEKGIAKGIEQGIEKGIEQGIEKGIEKGIKRGTVNTLISLVKDGILSIDEAAPRADMSVEDFEKYLR